MDENTWRLAQVVMWFIGLQTAILGGIFIFMWNNLSKRIEDLSIKIEDLAVKIDRIEENFSAKAEDFSAKIDNVRLKLMLN